MNNDTDASRLNRVGWAVLSGLAVFVEAFGADTRIAGGAFVGLHVAASAHLFFEPVEGALIGIVVLALLDILGGKR